MLILPILETVFLDNVAMLKLSLMFVVRNEPRTSKPLYPSNPPTIEERGASTDCKQNDQVWEKLLYLSASLMSY